MSNKMIDFSDVSLRDMHELISGAGQEVHSMGWRELIERSDVSIQDLLNAMSGLDKLSDRARSAFEALKLRADELSPDDLASMVRNCDLKDQSWPASRLAVHDDLTSAHVHTMRVCMFEQREWARIFELLLPRISTQDLRRIMTKVDD